MKKILVNSFSILILLLTVNARSNGQHTGKTAFHEQPDFISKYFDSKTLMDSSLESPITEISTKAVRHFIKSFKQAEDVHWFKAVNGLVAHFTMNGIRSRADYDKKGNWLYNIRCYDESQLPKDIRAQVKSMFYDFSITLVNEISDEERTAYIIQIEDKTSLKTLSIYDGEMNVINEYVKSK